MTHNNAIEILQEKLEKALRQQEYAEDGLSRIEEQLRIQGEKYDLIKIRAEWNEAFDTAQSLVARLTNRLEKLERNEE